MMKIYDAARGMFAKDPVENTKISRTFRNCDRVQIDFGSSGVTSLEIEHRLDEEAEWISAVGPIAPTEDSELYIIPDSRYQRIVFVDGDDTQIAWATRTSSTVS